MTRKLWEVVAKPINEEKPSLRLLKTYGEGEKVAKVYKDRDWGEHRVKHFVGGVHQTEADYHTDDAEDAHDTAKYWVNQPDPVEKVVADRNRKDTLARAGIKEEGEGYPANRDPKMLAAEPGAEARFVAKHVGADPKKVTDVDDSTHDDKLFKATNIKRAVPGPNGDTHGHTPVGRDAAVYEAVALAMAGRVFSKAGSAIAAGTAKVGRGVISAARSERGQKVIAGAKYVAKTSVANSLRDNAGYVGGAIADQIQGFNNMPAGERAIYTAMQMAAAQERARREGKGQNTIDVHADNNVRDQMARARGAKQ